MSDENSRRPCQRDPLGKYGQGIDDGRDYNVDGGRDDDDDDDGDDDDDDDIIISAITGAVQSARLNA